MLNVTNAEGVQLQAKLFRGFADPARLSILQVLQSGPLTVTEIVAATGMSQSNTSNHRGLSPRLWFSSSGAARSLRHISIE